MENDGAKGNSRSPEIHLLVSFLFYLAREWNFSSLRDDDDETYQHRLLEFGRFHRAVMTSIPVSRDDWPFSLNPTFYVYFPFRQFSHTICFSSSSLLRLPFLAKLAENRFSSASQITCTLTLAVTLRSLPSRLARESRHSSHLHLCELHKSNTPPASE